MSNKSAFDSAYSKPRVNYQEILERNPTTAERDAGVVLIRRGGERALRARLLASDEAFEPFLQAALS